MFPNITTSKTQDFVCSFSFVQLYEKCNSLKSIADVSPGLTFQTCNSTIVLRLNFSCDDATIRTTIGMMPYLVNPKTERPKYLIFKNRNICKQDTENLSCSPSIIISLRNQILKKQ